MVTLIVVISTSRLQQACLLVRQGYCVKVNTVLLLFGEPKLNQHSRLCCIFIVKSSQQNMAWNNSNTIPERNLLSQFYLHGNLTAQPQGSGLPAVNCMVYVHRDSELNTDCYYYKYIFMFFFAIGLVLVIKSYHPSNHNSSWASSFLLAQIHFNV